MGYTVAHSVRWTGHGLAGLVGPELGLLAISSLVFNSPPFSDSISRPLM